MFIEWLEDNRRKDREIKEKLKQRELESKKKDKIREAKFKKCETAKRR